MTSLLPPNSTATERALEAATAPGFDLPVEIASLSSPDTCPPQFLASLAWGLSVDSWDSNWTDARKREVIKASVEVHRRKGTVGSIKRALAAMGYGDAVLREGFAETQLGQERPLGRGWRLAASGHWADYAIDIQTLISRADADLLVARLAAVAPVRCRLRRISFAGVRHVLGRDVWSLGASVPLGGVYNYEVT